MRACVRPIEAPPPRYSQCAAAAALILAALLCRAVYAGGPPLPTPCLPGTCGPVGPSTFIASGHATATQAGNTLTVKQTSTQAALNWASFNIAQNYKVDFQQPSASSVALNRIYQASPSAIFGSLQA